MGLSKTYGGARPIAIVLTDRRLAGKVVMSKLGDTCTDLFTPKQLGVGTPKGAEIGVHSIRKYVMNTDYKALILKNDYRNAFNCARRDFMLEKVKIHAAETYPFVWQAYGKPSNLYFGE